MPAPPPAGAPPESLRGPRWMAGLALLVVLALLYAAFASRAQPARLLPPPTTDAAPARAAEAQLVLAGGCFWGVQAVFQHTHGVLSALSGYAGGEEGDANYPAVSSGRSGHAEAVAIRYDPGVITLGELLQIFFSVAHDPTEQDRQGPDLGPQYRSAVFFQNPEQRDVAQAYIAQLDATGLLRGPIATEVTALQRFYPAETGHQDYATRNPNTLYVATYDRPKLENFKALLPERYRDEPALVLK